ncbi:MAG: hypothetical protein P1V21_04330 [Rhizobiaceae bacterium]|nr:hypothetical protein [Rhizobiaceae bacterium]MDF2370002.1 hypothetical protein [Rhizobiaceae bacterium]
MKRYAVVLSILLMSVGCAKRPDAITPVSMPSDVYTLMGCSKLSDELTREQQNLDTLSRAQNDAATGDALGVFLVGLPLASATGGDKEGLIAVSKGKVQALESAKLRKGC